MSEYPAALDTLVFNLPVGFVSKGQRFDTFAIGPLRGRLRRELATANNPYTQKLLALKHAITQLGNLEMPPIELISRLTLQDVDYIMLMLCARELDGKINIESKCPTDDGGCGGEVSVSLDLSKVGLVPGNDVQYNDKLVYQECSFTNPRTKATDSISFKIATIKDMEGAAESFMRAARRAKGGDTQALSELINMGLSKDIIQYNSKPGLSVEDLENMDLRVYDAIVAVRNRDVDPRHIDSEVAVTCPHCGHKFITNLDTEAWMAPFASPSPSKS